MLVYSTSTNRNNGSLRSNIHVRKAGFEPFVELNTFKRSAEYLTQSLLGDTQVAGCAKAALHVLYTSSNPYNFSKSTCKGYADTIFGVFSLAAVKWYRYRHGGMQRPAHAEHEKEGRR